MKIRLFVLFMLLWHTATFAQQGAAWSKWGWLTGEWAGDGKGLPGQGLGTFSFKTSLDDKIMMRTSRAEFPGDNGQTVAHDDLMIIYAGEGNSPKAIYFDNEGHVINYTITYADKTIVMTSEKQDNTMAFRLTYTLLEADLVDTKFEISNNGSPFTTYVEGKSRKVK